MLEAKSHVQNCKNHFEAQRLRIFEYTTYNSHFKLFDYMASNTDVVKKNYTITRLYYVSISVSIYLLQTCPPPNQNQIFKIPITMTCSRDEETHVQLRNGRIDSNQILHINSLAGPSNIFDMTSKLVEGFQRGVGAKTGLSH